MACKDTNIFSIGTAIQPFFELQLMKMVRSDLKKDKSVIRNLTYPTHQNDKNNNKQGRNDGKGVF